MPGDHDSMVLEPNVRVLAARLRDSLDTAETSQQPRPGNGHGDGARPRGRTETTAQPARDAPSPGAPAPRPRCDPFEGSLWVRMWAVNSRPA